MSTFPFIISNRLFSVHRKPFRLNGRLLFVEKHEIVVPRGAHHGLCFADITVVFMDTCESAHLIMGAACINNFIQNVQQGKDIEV